MCAFAYVNFVFEGGGGGGIHKSIFVVELAFRILSSNFTYNTDLILLCNTLSIVGVLNLRRHIWFAWCLSLFAVFSSTIGSVLPVERIVKAHTKNGDCVLDSGSPIGFSTFRFGALTVYQLGSMV